MSLKDHMHKLTSGLDDVEPPAPDARPRRGTGSIPATTSLMHFSEDMQDMAKENARLKAEHGQARMIELDLIDDSPYQIGGLEQARVDGLVANLRENKLNTPISLRPKPNGRFETLAGHHRRAAYRVLGRTEIEATIRADVSDEQASDLVFYDNLFAPSLSAFDRYQGFARIRNRGVLQSDIAIMSGLTPAAISYYFLFEVLPEDGRKLIESNPRPVTLEHVRALGPLAGDHPARVVEAIGAIISRGASPAEARRLVEEGAKRAPARSVEPTKIRQGKRLYASISVRDKKLVVDFASAEEAKELERQIAELLRVRVSAAARE